METGKTEGNPGKRRHPLERGGAPWKQERPLETGETPWKQEGPPGNRRDLLKTGGTPWKQQGPPGNRRDPLDTRTHLEPFMTQILQVSVLLSNSTL